jgi:arsenate reductase (glutaredoxin)
MTAAVTIYGIKSCDTMRKARAWLAARGIDATFHDYRVAGISGAQLRVWAGEVGWEALLNRAGTTFRQLPEADKACLNEDNALALMVAQPAMIKRPVLVYGNNLIVGFSPAAYAEAYKGAFC